MVRVIDGDLLESKADIICHQVNCQGKMGSGVAKAIREKYPEVYKRYKALCANYSSCCVDLLGINQSIVIEDYSRLLINMFAQNAYGHDGKQYTDYEALQNCMSNIAQFARENKKTVAMPYKIGCVRGGADWNKVYAMIENIFEGCEVELWRLDKG